MTEHGTGEGTGAASSDRPAIAALVLAAGSSRRLGRPKQLLPYGDRTLLDATLESVGAHGFEQALVTVGGAAAEVRESVRLDGFTVIDSLHHTDGCSSSIVSALAAIHPTASGLMLFLGDQPHVPAEAVAGLRAAAAAGAPMAVVRYRNGRGHPFWFSAELFGELALLHGDKAVWKLLESGRWPVTEVAVDLDVPLDVDTEDDYRRLLAAAASTPDGPAARGRPHGGGGGGGEAR